MKQNIYTVFRANTDMQQASDKNKQIIEGKILNLHSTGYFSVAA